MKKLVFITFLCIAQIAISQNYKFGKVSEEELLEKTNPDYPEANATVLYKKQQISFEYIQGKGFIQKNEIQERIKIYNKEGFDYATRLVRLYDGSSSYGESLNGLKAVTYNLDGGKIIEDKLKKDGIFEEETNKNWKTSKFTMPNIKEGCVIEFEYTIESQLSGIDDIEFQELIPIRKLEIKLKTPEYYVYKTFLNPRASYIPVLNNSKENRTITFSNKERTTTNRVSSTQNYTSTRDYIDNVVEANLSNIPPLKTESYVDNLSNYQAKLIVELERIQYPGESIEYLSTSWEKVTKTIYDYPEFGDQLNKKGYYNSDVDAILTGITDPQQKAAIIFNYVKSKVKWNEYHGYTTDAGVSKAYKEGVGNVADINLMLTSMLRYAGLNANPVLVSTKSNGIPLIPTRTGFNYVICALETSDSAILLDATQKFSTADILPTKALNWLGRLIRQDGSSDWIELIPKISSRESVSLNIKLNSDLSANGKVRNQFTNYQAFRVRDRFENYNTDEMIESLEKGKGELEISNFEIENMNDVSQPVTQSYDYVFNNAMEDIGGKLYLTPMLFLAPDENPFKENVRNYPIDYVYPIADKYMINIMLPDGYAIETMPESVKYQFNISDGEFTYLARQNGNMLQFTISLDLNKTLVLPSDYEQYKKFYQLMIEKQTEKVVLKKI
ncbi:hypothetical protein GCM10011531_25760 [Aquaticitalea lipolytica]|jgi:hypothetical protein|uniref:DUF3857 domain-containing protein n=1 Tax=Aquaticitalea lipolytica TaxID=1247562 RepID=A0A8J2TSF1_9FLAO|nr:DUF3857 domain-containing protein [Aquaticitalea lipolytica]GFZ92792.1 hypothetical protein GCM10011531_25760 [Aquaticitalea lipolytica]